MPVHLRPFTRGHYSRTTSSWAYQMLSSKYCHTRYAVEVEKHGVLVPPIAHRRCWTQSTYTRHAAAAINEPNASGEANVFAQASVVEAIGLDAEIQSFVVFCIFACS